MLHPSRLDADIDTDRNHRTYRMNGADVVAEILKREGTTTLPCYPRNPLIDAAAKADIRPIFCRQERVGVGIADGFSRIRRGRQNGVFAAQQGPGIENAFPGIAQAYSENVPILIIPLANELARQYTRPNFRAADVLAPVTKWSAIAHSVKELPDLMRRAFQAMRSGKPGPVLVEIPGEVFDAPFDGALDYTPVPMLRAAPDPDAIKEAARLLLAAKNPVLWAGQGIHYAEAGDRLAALAELVPAPVVATNPGKSAIPDSHPLALGASTRQAPKMFFDYMARADLVFAIGSSLTRTFVRSNGAARQEHRAFDQRPLRHQQGLQGHACRRRRRGAGDRRVDREGWPSEGPDAQRQCSPRDGG
jgi:acetolactate synthase I/II/III large subunit